MILMPREVESEHQGPREYRHILKNETKNNEKHGTMRVVGWLTKGNKY